MTPRGTTLNHGLSNRTGKLGKRVWSFSLPRVATCPGMSQWCRESCYMAKLERMYKTMLASYHENFENAAVETKALRAAILEKIPKIRNLRAIRIHVDGDFFNAGYVRMWASIAVALPETRFYAYTRSWRVKRLRKSLETLRAVPNFTLWASTDPTTEDPPAEWRTAWIDGDDRATGPICPEQRGKKADCGECGLCVETKLRNIRFVTH